MEKGNRNTPTPTGEGLLGEVRIGGERQAESGVFEIGHNQLQWAKVRKRAILGKTTMDDWENANTFQRQVMHQIELAILSVTQDDYTEETDDTGTDTLRAGFLG